jgi:predicted ribosome quality control (RQC) complex YloA/Tae2 family protein
VNDATLKQIFAELSDKLIGKKFGKIFQFSRLALAIDFRLPDSLFFFVSIEPSAPRIYFIKRRLRDLEKQSSNLNSFGQILRKRLSNSVLQEIEKIEDERILLFRFATQNELGQTEQYVFVTQLTGRSANLFLLDGRGIILDKLRETFGKGQETGGIYSPPGRENGKKRIGIDEIFSFGNFESLSESLDNFYLEKEAEQVFQNKAKAAESKIAQEIKKREKLIQKLNQDLTQHGDAEKWKRFGDLILANLADAVQIDGRVLVVDYFDENVPTIEIEIDETDELTEAAGKFFRRYTKARNAKAEVSKRLEILQSELVNLESQKKRLEKAVSEKDEGFLDDFIGFKQNKSPLKQREKKTEDFKGARRFVSSDGFDILVGKGAKDNDYLTFRIANSLDLWLHTADYPGSHVIIKNPYRAEIPPKTLLEAAQLAAFYSTAREQPKVAVHYTQKKFVNKPKGASVGLVSLASFKTILVEPKISGN